MSANLTGCLTKQGYLIKKSDCETALVKSFIKDLTAKPIVISAYAGKKTPAEESFPIYFESPNYYFLPRFWAISEQRIQSAHPFTSNRLKAGSSMNSGVKFVFDLYPHQHKGYAAASKSLNEIGGGVLSLPCGYGNYFLKSL